MAVWQNIEVRGQPVDEFDRDYEVFDVNSDNGYMTMKDIPLSCTDNLTSTDATVDTKNVPENTFSGLSSKHTYENTEVKMAEQPGKVTPHKKVSNVYCSGMTSLDSNRIVIVTKDGEFLVFDEYGRFLFLKEFPEHYEDITFVKNKEVATTSGYCIKFYNIESTSITEKEDECIDYQFAGEISVHGLHYVSDKFLITCNLQGSCVEQVPFIRLINMKGKTLRTFHLQGLVSPAYITSTADLHHIFICDHGKKRILSFDKNGTVQWEAVETSTPKYLTIDGKNMLIVSSELSSSLKCFTLSGKTLNSIETDVDTSSSPFLLFYKPAIQTLLICPEEQLVGANQFVYIKKIKKPKRIHLLDLLPSHP